MKGSVDLPAIVDNDCIKKTEILPQPEHNPPLAMAAAVKMIEIYMILEQVRWNFQILIVTLTNALGFVLDQRPFKNTCRGFFPELPSARS